MPVLSACIIFATITDTNVKKIIQRTATGIVYVALIVLATIGGNAFFASIFSLITVLGIYELTKLCCKENTRHPLVLLIDFLGGLLMFLSTFFFYEGKAEGANPVVCYVPYLIVRLIVQLYVKKEDAIKSCMASALTQLYVAFPITLLNLIYFEYGTPQLLLIGFIFIWMNDTGAFCIGSMIGKHRLFERISPKKSWEGFYGGLFFNLILAIVIYSYFNDAVHNYTLLEWTLFAVMVTLFATWGDLVESLIKRTAGAKDSGNLLPGHGGILDRIDSLLLVAPISVIYFYLTN